MVVPVEVETTTAALGKTLVTRFAVEMGRQVAVQEPEAFAPS